MGNRFEANIKQAAENTGLYMAWASMATVDRDGELVIPAAIKNLDAYLSKNPVVFYDHGWASYASPSEGTLPIGKAISASIVEEKGLLVQFQFAPHEFAQSVKELVDMSVLNTLSIGFIGHSFLDGDEDKMKAILESGIPLPTPIPRRVFTSVELLEFSVVGIPSNPDAEIIRAMAPDKQTKVKSIIAKLVNFAKTDETGKSNGVSPNEKAGLTVDEKLARGIRLQ